MDEFEQDTHTDPVDGMTVYGGSPECRHQFEEMPGEPPVDVCLECGGEKY